MVNLNRDENFNNPLLYIIVVFILASFSYEIYSRNVLLAIFYIFSFFIFILYFKGIYISSILIIFFIVSFNNNIWFYSYEPKESEQIRITEIKNYYGKGEIEGRIVNLFNINEEIKEGDRLIVNGKFTENKNITRGIIGDYEIKDFIKLEPDFIYKLCRRREYIFQKVEKKLGQRKAALITAVSFGYVKGLDQDHKELMKSLGISHAISVSGLHLVLVYGILNRLFGIKLSLVIAFVYVLFSGASPPAIRAYIMIFILTFGKVFKRNYNPLASLALSGIIILLIKPYDIYDIGFILSFLATLGIILFNRDLNKKLYKLPNTIRSTIAISLSAQVFTFPMIILCFNEVSLNFIIGNIIIIPLINLLVILGNILIFAEMIPIIFNYILYLCHYIIKYIDIIMYKIDGLGLELAYLHYTVAYFYIALLTAFYFYKKGFKRFLYYPVIIFCYILLLIYSPLPKIRYFYEGALLISYKGNRVLIQTKDVIDKEKLMAISLTDKIIYELYEVDIGKSVKLKKYGENYILNTGSREYLLFVNYEKIRSKYDIIDFRKGDLKEITLFDDKVINN